MKKYIYLDLDGVLCLGSEIHPKLTQWGYVHRFNAKAVKVFNEILEKTEAEIIISSDWKDHYTLEDFKGIFEWQKVIKHPIDITKSLPNKTINLLEEQRAMEILEHVDVHKPTFWVAIDDLDLKYWINNNHFVHTPLWMEGIKQTGKKQEIINKLTIW
ncbi:MAG TPA: HAD domain-containing protein [Bacilli bacterium]|jgi:hypothetical protein|nr:HAD domain-containing protein [Bacilli bacterium]